MGPNDPFPVAADKLASLRGQISQGTTMTSSSTAYAAAGAGGLAVGFAVWFLGWPGALFISAFGLGGIAVLWVGRLAQNHLDLSGAWAALKKR